MSSRLTLLKCLSHPDRLRICELLTTQEMTVNTIAATMQIEQAVISQHLCILYDAKLIKKRKAGTTVHCTLQPGLGSIIDGITRKVKEWQAIVDKL